MHILVREAYSCGKCRNNKFESEEIRTTGAGLSRFLDLQNKKFAAISCSECGYTELYRMGGGGILGTIGDLFTG